MDKLYKFLISIFQNLVSLSSELNDLRFVYVSILKFQELKDVIRDVPEIEELVGSEEANQVFCISEQDEEKVKSVVRTIFTLLMSAGPNMTKEIVFRLKRRLHMESQVSHGFARCFILLDCLVNAGD